MQLIQTVAPIEEPLTLAETKEFLRVLDDDSDVLITSLIIAVREHVENVTNRQLLTATFELISSDLKCVLPKGSLQSISKIEYLDENGDYILLDTSDYYKYIEYGIGHINYVSTPSLPTHKEAVKITFICGYLEVPESIKAYMKVKVSTLFENREQFVIGASIAEFGNKFVENLLSSYRIRSI